MVRRWVLNFLEYVGRRWVPTMMRWLARDRADLIRPAPGAPAWQDTGGSPLTIWLMDAAKRRSFESPTMQRDLNAALEILRLDSFNKPLMMLYVGLMAEGKYPIEEIFARVLANVLLLGFVAGQLHAQDPAPTGAAPSVDAEFIEGARDAGTD